MENHLRFYKGEKDTLCREGFAYSFVQELKNYSGWKKAYKCAKGCHCRARIWTTGEWEADANKRQYQRGISISHEHNHANEKSDKNGAAKTGNENATGGKIKQKKGQGKPLNRIENGIRTTEIQREAEPPKKVERPELADHLRFYRGENDSLCHEGFAYTFAQDLKNHSGWSKAYKCSKGCHCRSRIWTTGEWEQNTQKGFFQRGIFIAAEHNHEPEEVAKKNAGTEKQSADTAKQRADAEKQNVDDNVTDDNFDVLDDKDLFGDDDERESAEDDESTEEDVSAPILVSIGTQTKRRRTIAIGLSAEDMGEVAQQVTAYAREVAEQHGGSLLQYPRTRGKSLGGMMAHEKSEARPRKRDYIKKQIKIIKEKSKVFAAQGERPTQYVITATENGNTIFPILDKTIKENGQLVFLVDKPYFTTDSIQYAFVHGASKVLLPLTLVLETVRVGSALYKDLTNEKKELRNTASAVSSIAGGWVGGAAGGYGGGQTGAAIGGTLGAFFGGVGAVPGAAIGVVCGSLIGAIGGGILVSTAAEKLAETLTDQYYGVPAEDVEILTEGEYELIEEQNTSSSSPEPIKEPTTETIDVEETIDELNDKSASDGKEVTENSSKETFRETSEGDGPNSIWLKLPFLTLNDIFSSKAASNNCDSLSEIRNDTTNGSEKANEQRGIWQKLLGLNKDMVKKENVTTDEGPIGNHTEVTISDEENDMFNDKLKTTDESNGDIMDTLGNTEKCNIAVDVKSEKEEDVKIWQKIKVFQRNKEILDKANDSKMETIDVAEPGCECLVETADESVDKERIRISDTSDDIEGPNEFAPNAINENIAQGSRNILHKLKFLKPIKDLTDGTNNSDNRTRNKAIDTKHDHQEVNASIDELKKQSESVSGKTEIAKNQANDTTKWYI
ncbi:hypothetical protein DdX_00441 [Ditylenchus destructor]|uniref:Uncharacterized protein n=1 Tax=Ditylenchus destructor TaxID=166010 RepID=A0AAD4NKJ9_9BILA|nr:hypothetical protein DdX_00441 [Ditylenchus destructor]